ncbi:hypothetical protein N7456_002660 [Penicillium angulare]|uniref:Uncharacterized protein n=1 Tax=Penicillium angulare TaxID=116970 RepID=A0A9W9G8Q8_9EURO|nr:hypothetical protein N7456_002660 [Penicillium angulare]
MADRIRTLSGLRPTGCNVQFRHISGHAYLWSLDRSIEATKAKGTGPETAQNPDLVVSGALKHPNHENHK